MTGPMRTGGAAAMAPVQPLPPAMEFSGKLYRGEVEGEVRGWLWDHKTRTRIEFNGCRDPRGNGYLIMGKVTDREE